MGPWPYCEKEFKNSYKNELIIQNLFGKQKYMPESWGTGRHREGWLPQGNIREHFLYKGRIFTKLN